MRAIDADALFREMEKAQWYNNADRDEIAEELVLNAPTIEQERKKGHWVGAREYCNHLNDEAKREGRTEKYMPSGMVIGVYCDQCWAINTKRGNYCSNCGARMEGES